jgi:GNAT superfamily N-acetyltransferase
MPRPSLLTDHDVGMGGTELRGITLRGAKADDARAIGGVFDASVRTGWTYLGELVREPMFTSADWDKLVAEHEPPNVLLVATDEADRVLGYTAVHPEDGEMFLLFVDPAHAGRGIGRMLLSAAHDALRCSRLRRGIPRYARAESARAGGLRARRLPL